MCYNGIKVVDDVYEILNELLSDHKGGVTFACFDVWHLCWIGVFFLSTVFSYVRLKDKSEEAKQKVLTTCINLAFGLYIADFFLMPFAFGKIEIEKLPFHICTAMCVMCFLSRHTAFFSKFRVQFAVYGLISNFVYLIYPAGVMWQQVHPLSYRVTQTLVFHGVMTVYGVLALMFDDDQWTPRKWYKDLSVIVAMTLWAMLGNYLYNGEVGAYSHFFNWFFVVRDPFYLIPEDVAPLIMPLLNVGLSFGVNMLIRWTCASIRAQIRKRQTDGHI